MESLRYLGSMAGHKGWITAIATSSENPDMILTASRGMYTSLSFPSRLCRAGDIDVCVHGNLIDPLAFRQDDHCLATYP